MTGRSSFTLPTPKPCTTDCGIKTSIAASSPLQAKTRVMASSAAVAGVATKAHSVAADMIARLLSSQLASHRRLCVPRGTHRSSISVLTHPRVVGAYGRKGWQVIAVAGWGIGVIGSTHAYGPVIARVRLGG